MGSLTERTLQQRGDKDITVIDLHLRVSGSSEHEQHEQHYCSLDLTVLRQFVTLSACTCIASRNLHEKYKIEN